jgi:hypothetical protein
MQREPTAVFRHDPPASFPLEEPPGANSEGDTLESRGSGA